MSAPVLPHAVVVMEAARQMRLHHMLWHTARDGWLRFDEGTRARYAALGWEPPRPSLDAQRRPILDNDSGEDFLYMHHLMIEEVNNQLAQVGDPAYPRVEGWRPIPAPGAADYPVPPPYSVGDQDTDDYLREVKSDTYFEQKLRPLLARYDDQQFLRGVTLGELGARVEFSVHNWAHMRWSAEPSEVRPDPPDPMAVDARFDDPSYDWLGDFYSSHVNSLFWKLHGWVDDRIGAWKAANAEPDYQWKGTWNGPGHHHVHRLLGAEEDPAELLALAAQAGVRSTPAARVAL